MNEITKIGNVLYWIFALIILTPLVHHFVKNIFHKEPILSKEPVSKVLLANVQSRDSLPAQFEVEIRALQSITTEIRKYEKKNAQLDDIWLSLNSMMKSYNTRSKKTAKILQALSDTKILLEEMLRELDAGADKEIDVNVAVLQHHKN